MERVRHGSPDPTPAPMVTQATAGTRNGRRFPRPSPPARRADPPAQATIRPRGTKDAQWSLEVFLPELFLVDAGFSGSDEFDCSPCICERMARAACAASSASL